MTIDLDTPLDNLELTRRPYNALRDHGCKTVADIRVLTDSELLRVPNIGRISLNEIRALLGPHIPPSPEAMAAKEKEDAFLDRIRATVQESIRATLSGYRTEMRMMLDSAVERGVSDILDLLDKNKNSSEKMSRSAADNDMLRKLVFFLLEKS